MPPTGDPPQDRRPTQTESEGLETNFSRNAQEKKARVAILISDKVDFKKRAIKRDPEGHFIIHTLEDTPRRHKYCKYICTQHRSTQKYNENVGHEEIY